MFVKIGIIRVICEKSINPKQTKFLHKYCNTLNLFFFFLVREEGELFGDDEEENDPMARQRYFEEYYDPYDILKVMMNYVDSDAGTCLHLATKVTENMEVFP